MGHLRLSVILRRCLFLSNNSTIIISRLLLEHSHFFHPEGAPLRLVARLIELLEQTSLRLFREFAGEILTRKLPLVQ